MNGRNVLWYFLAAAALTACGGDDDNDNGGGDNGGEQQAYELQLLHFADVDGGRDIINNAVRFSAILDDFRTEYSNTLVLSSGDNWIPGPEYNVSSDDALAPVVGVPANGRAHVAYLNAMGVQASAFGNHEFDLGTGEVANLLAAEEGESATWPGASFPYLAANLDFSSDESLAPLMGTDGAMVAELANKVAASTVISVGGEQIGIVGATTPTLDIISSPGDVSIYPTDSDDTAALAAEIQASVDALTATGINKIIVLAHMQQIAIEKALAPLLSDVDIIVAGGSNTILADSNDRLRDGDTAVDTYPLSFTSAADAPVLVVNTDGDYTYLGRLVVKFDENGVLLTGELDSNINGVYATDETGLVENGLSSTDAIAEVVTISETLTEALVARAGNVFGLTSVYLNGERGSVRTQETNLGNLTARANLSYAQALDATTTVSIKNGGGIRASIGSCYVPPGATGPDAYECHAPAGVEGVSNPGEISQLDLEIALRFNNSLSLLTMTGAQLKEVLEHAVAASGGSATPGQFPQVAGITFTYDMAQTPRTVNGDTGEVEQAGARIRSLTVLDSNGAADAGVEISVVENGEFVGEAATQAFRVVTLGYLATGGDGYPFPTGSAANVIDMTTASAEPGSATFADYGTEQDALAEYLLAYFPADQDEATPSFDEADTGWEDDHIIVRTPAAE